MQDVSVLTNLMVPIRKGWWSSDIWFMNDFEYIIHYLNITSSFFTDNKILINYLFKGANASIDYFSIWMRPHLIDNLVVFKARS